jgi:large subunit ribosomal protein L10
MGKMVAKWKLKEIEELTEKVSKSKVIGLVSIGGIPSRQFQVMRKRLRGTADLRVGRNSLIKRSFEKAGVKNLDKHIQGSMGLIFTDLNPFKLNKILESNRISAPAKEGSVAPKDIIVPAGDTSLAAGPIIGDLQKAKIKAQIKGGKIVVVEDSLVVKEGERFSSDQANVLTRLGIEPMEMGLNLNAVYEGGVIYTSDILNIDETKTISDIQTTYKRALNLALNSRVYNNVTIKYLLNDAFGNALNLALNAEILNRETVGYLLSKANREMHSLASRIPDAMGEDLKSSVSPAPVREEDAGEDKEKEKPEEEKEGKTEEDAAAGLTSLFD